VHSKTQEHVLSSSQENLNWETEAQTYRRTKKTRNYKVCNATGTLVIILKKKKKKANPKTKPRQTTDKQKFLEIYKT